MISCRLFVLVRSFLDDSGLVDFTNANHVHFMVALQSQRALL